MNDGTSPVDGVWQMVRAELSGDPAPDLVVRQTVVELDEGTYTVRFAGQAVDRGHFELGAVAGARTMLLRGTAGPNAGRTIPCLYQCQGDRLRVCYGMDGIAPNEFATAADDARYLATYRRAPSRGDSRPGRTGGGTTVAADQPERPGHGHGCGTA